MLKQRIITALVLLPIVLVGLFVLNPKHFSWFVAFVVGIGAWEWARLAGAGSQLARVAYAAIVVLTLFVAPPAFSVWVMYGACLWWVVATFLVLSYPKTAQLWSAQPVRYLIGLLILIPFWLGMVLARSSEVTIVELNTLWVLLYILLIVWAADTGAYFSGKAWGKAKLAPQVSPGKSWAGAWGGIASCSILAVVSGNILGLTFSNTLVLLLITCCVGAFSIIGDLTESMFKREAGIKDSSALLPGHGGILDRIDSLTATVPLFVVLLLLTGWLR